MRFYLSACLIAATAAAVADTNQSGEFEVNSPLAAITPDELGFTVTHWTVEDGLPERNVTSLAQTPDGFLWCGTYTGLARYDGEHFVVFDSVNTPALDELRIQELHCDSAGRLWIGGSSGELVVYQNGVFQRLGEADRLPNGQAGKMGEDSHGDFWVMGRSGNRFYRYRNNHFESVAPSLPDSGIDRFVVNSTGLKWAVDAQRRTMIRFSDKGDEVVNLDGPEGRPETTLGRFFRLQDDTLAVTSSRGIYALRDGQWVRRMAFAPAIPDQVLDGVEDWDGNFWVNCADTSLVVCGRDGSTKRVVLPEQASNPSLRALQIDSEGNLWAAGGAGLFRIRRNLFRPEPGLAETRDAVANAVVTNADGDLWLLFAKGLARLRASRWDYFPTTGAEAEAQLRTGAPSRDGGLYLEFRNIESGQEFVDKWTASGKRQRLGELKGYPRAILERQNGELWATTDRGIWRLEHDTFQRVPIAGAAPNDGAYAMIEDPEGRLWVGVFRRGLFRQETNGTWRQLSTASDFGSRLIVGLFLDEAGTLWVATNRGLARWRQERWHAYTNADGTLPGWVHGVASDGHGGLWLTSQFGVTRVKRNVLNAMADGKEAEVDSSRFDRSDGLPSVTCLVGQSAVLRSADDRIWVATAEGAAVTDVTDWMRRREQRSPPPISIESVLVDDKLAPNSGKQTSNSETAPIVVPPGRSRLEFRYTAINLTANRKSRFRYRLDGFDKDWVEASGQRSVAYHALPPGDYRFQVTAANNYGQWNNSGAFVRFTVQPHWWQTLWFKIGAGVTLFGILWFSRSVKLRQLRRERVRREEFSRRLIQSQEDERKRIAAELHDSLGQNLLIAKNQLYLVQEMTGNEDARIQPKLELVTESVGAALDEARTISHRLRPFQLERLGLTKAIGSMLKQISDSTKLPIKSRIESLDGSLPPESEVMIYRILQEALNNIVKHADASQAQITVEKREQIIRMVVQDDGRGFNLENMLSDENTTRGLGLSSFEERAHLLGGQFHCQSAPGQGVSLTFEIPIPETNPGEAKN